MVITTNTKNLGWAYSTTQTDKGMIVPPNKPMYVGTPYTIISKRNTDMGYKSLGGAFCKERYFLDGKIIKTKVKDLDESLGFLLAGFTNEIHVSVRK